MCINKYILSMSIQDVFFNGQYRLIKGFKIS
jgi:hypothetical protein